jgi:hypothetical protein
MDDDATIRHRLSVIRAADIAGDSPLMGQDEAARLRAGGAGTVDHGA